MTRADLFQKSIRLMERSKARKTICSSVEVFFIGRVVNVIVV